MKSYTWAKQLKRKSYQKSLRAGKTFHLIVDRNDYRFLRRTDPVETSLCGLKPDSWDRYQPSWMLIKRNHDVMNNKPTVTCGKCTRMYMMLELAE